MKGLKIETVTGLKFEVRVAVTFRDTQDGKVYYCAGQSWPAEIVKKVLN